MPKKTGEDASTQLDDGELFNFEEEVEPMLDVLCDKLIEQSRMEVLEEEEQKVIKDQQREFEQVRNAELIEAQQLEASEDRKKCEKVQ